MKNVSLEKMALAHGPLSGRRLPVATLDCATRLTWLKKLGNASESSVETSPYCVSRPRTYSLYASTVAAKALSSFCRSKDQLSLLREESTIEAIRNRSHTVRLSALRGLVVAS